MSLWIKLHTTFYTHRKTMRLRVLLGDDALWIPPRLWAVAADQQPDGDFSKYSAEEIAMLVGYSKDASSMLQALLQAGFMDEGPRIHGWEEYNGHHVKYSERARNAAVARWNKVSPVPPSNQISTDENRIDEQASPKHASSIPQASIPQGEKACVPLRKKDPTGPNPRITENTEKLSRWLQAFFLRPPNEPWSPGEESAIFKVAARPAMPTELTTIQAFAERSERRFFPQTMSRLLADWQETLDRARISPEALKPQSKEEADRVAFVTQAANDLLNSLR